MDIDAGPIEDLPTDRCTAVGDGRAVVALTDDGPLAFQARCLHRDSPLDGGMLVDGKLQCPLHFWRYRLPEGEHTGGRGSLQRHPTRIEAGRLIVELPDPGPALSLREQLLAHAQTWDRDATARPMTGGST